MLQLQKSQPRRKKWPLLITLLLVLISLILLLMWKFELLPHRYYSAEEFGITTLLAATDFNQNGVDDYTDIMLGALQDAENKPRYNGQYWETGYPPDNIGVCTDVVWRAFKNAGYSLRSMVDNDIAARPEAYSISAPDSNIDFRRVSNLHVFFKQYAIALTLDFREIEQWQPGDIVIFRDDAHIGIVSALRNRDGVPYLLHNGGQSARIDNYLPSAEITGHYRFDASLLPQSMLVPWLE